MKNRATATLPALMLATAVLGVFVPDALGQEQKKLAQTGMKFLSASVHPRAAAMGDAMTAIEGGSLSLFYNPAAMASQEATVDVVFGQMQWIADIDYNMASLSFKPGGGRWGVFGFSFSSVDYGTVEQTIRADNEQGFIDLDPIKPTAMSLGFGYARALTDRFRVGGQVKYALQDLGSSVLAMDSGGAYETAGLKESILAFDFGVLYRTGFRSLTFAINARNFAEEIVYVEESFQLPLTLRIGLAMDMTDFMPSMSDSHSLLFAVEAETPRDYAEQIKIGGEYLFLNTLALRAGYVFPTDEQGINLGVGLQQSMGGVLVGADYAYTSFGVFSNVHRVALRFAL